MNSENGPPFRRPVPPFTQDSALEKVRLAENGWNSRDPEKVAQASTPDAQWRDRSEFIRGRAAIAGFLARKWQRELEFRLLTELWAFDGCRIAVRFASEWHDGAGRWARSYGNEHWEFRPDGLLHRRYASINDISIAEADRLLRWDDSGPRPLAHSGLTELGL